MAGTSGYGDTYYAFANFISDYCLSEFCKETGIQKEEIEGNFTYPVIASEFFTE